MTVRALAALSVFAAACSGGPEDLLPFELNFSFDISAIGGCPSSQCSFYGMACDTVLQVRVTDADSGEVIAELCEEVTGQDACDLFSITGSPPGEFLSLPPKMVQIQVAAWRREVLVGDPILGTDCVPDDVDEDFCCPQNDIFDLQGVPLSNFSPQPAFGGAAYFDVTSDDSTVTVPLACPDPEQVNDPGECQLPDALVTAVIDDMENLVDRLTEEQARALFDISATQPRPQTDGEGETFYVIQAGDKVDLDLKEPIEAIPSFQAFSDRRFDEVACVTLLESGGGAETQSTCQSVVQPDPSLLSLFGHFLERDTVVEIKSAMNLPALPSEGLVIGRVINHEGDALDNVQVAPVLSDATVQYLNSERTGVIGLGTSTSGFFMSTDAPFNTQWTASHMTDGRREDGEYRAGLIRGNVTLLVIQMQPPP